MKTITYPENIYKLVPIDQTDEMSSSGTLSGASIVRTNEIYRSMIAVAPDALPGVVEHSGNPSWYLMPDNGRLCECSADEEWAIPVFTHPPTQAEPMHEQNARFAIDGAIACGMQGTNKPPEADHWLMEYWNIGAQIAAQSGQEPYCWFHQRTATIHRTSHAPTKDCFPLYISPPAPANSLAIVQAALEAVIKIIDPVDDAHHLSISGRAIASIRAINPQSILDGMSK